MRGLCVGCQTSSWIRSPHRIRSHAPFLRIYARKHPNDAGFEAGLVGTKELEEQYRIISNIIGLYDDLVPFDASNNLALNVWCDFLHF